MSILPKKAVTRPSGRIATQESSSVGRSGGLTLADASARASPTSAEPVAETIRAPEAFRNSRRGSCMSMRAFMIVSSGHLLLGALDRAHDGHVRGTAALEPGERFA